MTGRYDFIVLDDGPTPISEADREWLRIIAERRERKADQWAAHLVDDDDVTPAAVRTFSDSDWERLAERYALHAPSSLTARMIADRVESIAERRERFPHPVDPFEGLTG